ncbi:hypothetical protein [Longimicrobium sp.]|jgi:hypothetical protein|uniref:hypothetical protein n=1 Tax=Longimicrobium sp. TaxID=2029185 RepID=UPI002ED7D62D
MTSKLVACLALLALPLAACEEPDGGPSYLRASLSGAVVEEYNGNAEWHVGTPGPGQQQFQIVSVGLGTDSNDDQFALTRWDGGRLREGRHPVSLVDLGDGQDYRFQPKGITIQYFRRVDGRMEQFVADSGFVEITRSTSNEVSGTFTITALRYCMMDERTRNEAPECSRRWQDVKGTPRITVTGTFVSTEFNPGPVRID